MSSFAETAKHIAIMKHMYARHAKFLHRPYMLVQFPYCIMEKTVADYSKTREDFKDLISGALRNWAIAKITENAE